MIHCAMDHVQAWSELGPDIRQRHEVIISEADPVPDTVAGPSNMSLRAVLMKLIRIVVITREVCTTETIKISVK